MTQCFLSKYINVNKETHKANSNLRIWQNTQLIHVISMLQIMKLAHRRRYKWTQVSQLESNILNTGSIPSFQDRSATTVGLYRPLVVGFISTQREDFAFTLLMAQSWRFFLESSFRPPAHSLFLPDSCQPQMYSRQFHASHKCTHSHLWQYWILPSWSRAQWPAGDLSQIHFNSEQTLTVTLRHWAFIP